MTNFARKLSRLVKTWPGSQKELAEKINITPQMLYEYLRGAAPRPTVLLALARELGVEHALIWFIDEEQTELVPPSATDHLNPLSKLSRYDLMREVCLRYIELAQNEQALLDRAMCINWTALAKFIIENGPGKPLPEEQYELARIAADLAGLHRINPVDSFDLNTLLQSHISEDGEFTKEMMPEEINAQRLVFNANTLIYRISHYLNSFITYQNNQSFKNSYDASFKKLESALKEETEASSESQNQ